MSETLLTPSSIKLYGRLLNDLQYNYDATTVTIGSNNFLQQQLFSAFGAAKAAVTCFARVYAFSFEGALYSLPKPSIFLVHGTGTPVLGSTKVKYGHVRRSCERVGILRQFLKTKHRIMI